MALLSWSTQYRIGDDTVDSQHQELFRLINDFHTHWLESRDRQEIARVLNQLISYAEMHFRDEERIMEDAGFPQLVEHQQIHEAMIDTIFKLHASYAEGGLRLEMDAMKFVKSWLVDHILENDYLFRDFLVRQKKAVDATTPAPE